MTDLAKLAELMRSDWNRRVGHDYRFWMSDGHSDDKAMWEAGKRDYEILMKGVESRGEKTLLDLGCGVGRLLRAASAEFGRVIGFDVSDLAISRAKEFLADCKNLELNVGNGIDLRPIEDGSVDVLISFAALTSMPTSVIAAYLREVHRVLKKNGEARLQVYLGKEQPVEVCDTLHLRCFERENFVKAVSAAGFRAAFIEELILPFQVSFREIGIEAMVASILREDRAPLSTEEISSLLLPGGEPDAAPEQSTSGQIEYWMTLNYAKDLAARGEMDRARAALEHALAATKSTAIDVRDLMDRLVSEIEKDERKGKVMARERAAAPAADSELYERNLRIVLERFPELEAALTSDDSREEISTQDTSEGPVLDCSGQCLDHPQKPKAGGEAWLKRAIDDKRLRNCSSVGIFGFGGGYHVEAALAATDKPVIVIEPSAHVLRRALAMRDLERCLRSVSKLVIGKGDLTGLFDQDSELLVRPQTQALHNEYCSEVKSIFYGRRGLGNLHPKIGILGPTQGGTLPIAFYVQRGLAGLRQRVRLMEMSGFAPGYHQLEKFVSDPIRQSNIQGTYIEMLSQVVLESINEKPVDILICMAQAPISGRVLMELRKRGVITVLWFTEDYLRFGYWKAMAQFYDFVFTIQKGNCLKAIKSAGAGEVHYLPMACDPAVHAPVIVPEAEKARWGSPISFVGAGYHNRQQMFASLADMPMKIWGTEWPGCRPFDRMVQEGGRRIAPEEYVKIFNSCEINLNLHSSTERDGVDPSGDFVNPRTFELAAANAFQLVDERSLLPDLFVPGKEVATFSNLQDLKDKIAYYLAHPEERARITAAARARVLKDHTYDGRLREMLSAIYSSRYETLRQREKDSPWSKMLERSKKHPELNRRCQTAFERGEEANLDGLVSDIITGKGKLTPTEQKLLFLFHIRKQIIRMNTEDSSRS